MGLQPGRKVTCLGASGNHVSSSESVSRVTDPDRVFTWVIWTVAGGKTCRQLALVPFKLPLEVWACPSWSKLPFVLGGFIQTCLVALLARIDTGS